MGVTIGLDLEVVVVCSICGREKTITAALKDDDGTARLFVKDCNCKTETVTDNRPPWQYSKEAEL